MPHWDQGPYTCLNPSKYIGFKQAFYRSRMEKTLFAKLDQNPKVLRWATELFSISYIFNLDQRKHQYWIDLYYESLNKDGQLEKFIVEIKPISDLSPPKQAKNKTAKSLKNYNYKMVQYNKNISKWSAATEFSRINNMKFFIMTDGGVFVFENGRVRQLTTQSYF